MANEAWRIDPVPGQLEEGDESGTGDSQHVRQAAPCAAPAMRRLNQAGVRVGCLTVGHPETTAAFLQQAGLAPYVDRVVTAREVRQWKPAPAIYRSAAAALGVPVGRLALVAVHAWDCHGARRAGCVAGWCARLEGVYGEVFTPPDVTGDDLEQVAEGLLAL